MNTISQQISENNQKQQYNTPKKYISNNNQFFNSTLQQLKIKKQKISQEQFKQISYVLFNILQYPNTELAFLHQQSNRLGFKDIKTMQQYNKHKFINEIAMNNLKNQFCQCCGLIKQSQTIPFCTPFEMFPNVGISTYLFFQTIKNLIFLTILMIIIFSIFSMTANYLSSTQKQLNFHNFTLIISFSANKINHSQLYLNIEIILEITFVCAWGFSMYFIKGFQADNSKMIDQQTVTAADFSIMIQGVPQNYNIQDLQQQFNRYYQQIYEIANPITQCFKIENYNISKPFHLNIDIILQDTLKKLNQNFNLSKQRFRNWIKYLAENNKLPLTKNKRNKYYRKYENLKKNRITKVENIQFEAQQKLKNNQEIFQTIFVTLSNSQSSQLIVKQHSKSWIQNLKYYLPCFNEKSSLKIKNQNGTVLPIKIHRAPQPQDVIWLNLGVPSCDLFQRRFLTYSVTFLILSISFGLVYLLSFFQNKYKGFDLSIIIPIIIAIMSVVISVVIRYLTVMEHNLTQTDHQTSLAIKSIVAQLINTIAVPIIVNLNIQNNLFEKNGLVDDVFYLGLSTAFISPLLKLFDPYYYFIKLNSWFQNLPRNKLYLSQIELNNYTQQIEFQVGYEYIYIVNLFLFTCFFVPLQPIISIFTLFGLLVMYQLQKYSLLNRMKRPIPGTDFVNLALSQLLSLAPILFTPSNFIWKNSIMQNVSFLTILLQFFAISLSIFIFILPFRTILECFFDSQKIENHQYQQKRLFMPTEYDRMNPMTSTQGIQKYMMYVEKLRQKENEDNKMVVSIHNLFTKIDTNSDKSKKSRILSLLIAQKGNKSHLSKILPIPQQNIQSRKLSNYIKRNSKKVDKNMIKNNLQITELNKQSDEQSNKNVDNTVLILKAIMKENIPVKEINKQCNYLKNKFHLRKNKNSQIKTIKQKERIKERNKQINGLKNYHQYFNSQQQSPNQIYTPYNNLKF